MTTTLEPRRSPEDVPPAPASPRRPNSRIAVMDGLRLVAALSVSLFHLAGDLPSGQAWETDPRNLFPHLFSYASFGWLGVELFFMISGFVICMSCWGRTPGQFFRSRVVRLFPAYWPAVLITTAVVTLWPVASHRLPTDEIILNLSMMNKAFGVKSVDSAYWTLWCELRFYVLFGVVMLWRGLTLHRTLLFCYGWLIAGAVAAAGKLPVLELVFQSQYAPLFVAGIAFFLIHKFGSNLQIWGAIALSWMMAMHNVDRRVIAAAKVGRVDLDPKVGMLVMTLFFVVLGIIALGWTARIQWRWLTYAGALTYPYYLLHQSIGWSLIHGLNGRLDPWLVLSLTIGILLVSAWLLHRLVEKPVAKLLKRTLDQASAAMRDSARQERERTSAASDPASAP
ncbi:acyltransferase family protein [Actinoplanes sp. NPDC020271]|uniref:acyltransferase family protein n=1 Tax=Actinoplanes sp. NPDC020271 TaxID=3363896 RepID=UPI0037AD252E